MEMVWKLRRKQFILAAAIAMMALCICSAAFGGAADRVEGEAQVTIKLAGISGREPTIEEIRDAAEEAARRAGAYVAYVYDAISKSSGVSCVLLKSDELTTDELIERLVVQPDVLSAMPNFTFTIDATEPNDPDYLNDKAWGMNEIKANAAWDRCTGSTDVYVAIIDSGINLEHEDLKDNLAEQTYWRNYVDNDSNELPAADADVNDTLGHGSHVAGIIGAVGNNGKGVVGVNWRVKMIPYRFLGANGGSAAMGKALNDVLDLLKTPNAPKIAAVNMSVGVWAAAEPNNYLRLSAEGRAITSISKLPNAPLLVASAGNEGVEADKKDVERNTTGSDVVPANSYHYPSDLSRLPEMTSLVSVAGTAKVGAYQYTNWSSEYIDVAAPAQSIYSTIHGGTNAYGTKSGTSMAAPHVAGAAALLVARLEAEGRGSEWNGAMLKELLIDTADGNRNPTSTYSGSTKISKHGQIDVAKAMESLNFVKVSKIDIVVAPDEAATSLPVGSEATLTAVFSPKDATDKRVKWSIASGDSVVEIIASDDTTATIRGKAKGTAAIEATAQDGSPAQGANYHAFNVITLTVTQTHEHSFDDKWESDGTHHWHECVDGDGAESGRAAHSGGEWDTSEAGVHKKTCEVCKAVYARDLHSAKSQSWEHDGSTHWHVCGTCGVKMDERSHDSNGDLKSDATDHWRLCSVCGERQGQGAHSWDTTLEYNEFKHMKKCLTCQYQQTPGDDHVWSPSWETDQAKHWHKCSTPGCGAESDHEDHRDQDDNGECDDCGAAVSHIHKGGEWQHDSGGHYKVCTGCLSRYDEGTHSIDMLADDDEHWNECAVCGYEEARAPHTYGGWGHGTFEHWQECGVCGKGGPISPHSFGENGICTVCEYFDADKVQAPELESEPPMSSDKVIDGQDVVWSSGAGNIGIEIGISWRSFIKVTMDGRDLVEGAEYILDRPNESGAAAGKVAAADGDRGETTRIYLTEQLLGRLPAGEHTVKCIFVGEDAVDVRFTVETKSDEARRKNTSGGACDAGFGLAAAVGLAALGAKTLRRRGK